MKAVALFSGGLDSTVLAWDMARRYDLYLIGVQYGQHHQQRELAAASRLAWELDVAYQTVDLTALQPLLHSALTGNGDVPLANHDDPSTVRAIVVPNRNAILLTVAFGYACSIGAGAVGYAANAGDQSPDCQPAFMDAFAAMEVKALAPYEVELYAPFREMSKAQVIQRGQELGAPLHLSWSCYLGMPRQCGTCRACTVRKEGFRQAKVIDGTEYL